LKVGLVIYGGIDTLSGGYLYDRKLVECLQRAGDSVQIINMPWQNYGYHLGHNFQVKWAQSLADLDVDVLLQDELNHPSLFLINRAIKKAISYPILSIVHHLRSSESHPEPLQTLYRRIERSYLQTIDGYIWNSQTTRKVVEGLVGKSLPGVVATPAGDRFEGLPEAEIMQRSRQPGPLKLLFVGNLISRKGLHRLIPALSSLQQESWILKVVGDLSVEPGYTRRIFRQVQKAGLEDRIQFLGRIPEEQLAQELRCSQVFVMPSFYEGFGIVYLEGMRFGLPSIASDSGAAHEIVENGVNGYLVDPEDPDQLAQVIRRYQDQPELLLTHSMAARRRFDTFPTWDQTTLKIRQFMVKFQKDS
jgi:glycosyltransferase involved in cell wall biosynthesis